MSLEKFPVEGSHILMFARSVGDANPVYADADAAKKTEAGGIIAPPTFVQASAQFDPTYGLRPKVGGYWHGSGKNPITRPPAPPEGAARPASGGGGGGGGLHAEQHYEYHRHLKPGDVLTAKNLPGKSWEKEGRRSGKLVFNESITEYRDQNGELVITARSVGVRTERPVDQAATEKAKA